MSDSGIPASVAPSANPLAIGAAAIAEVGGINRRLAERKLLRGKAVLQVPGRPAMDVRTLDISTSGMAVVAPDNLPPSATCTIQFVLPLKRGRQTVQLNARIVHSVFSNAEGGVKVGMQFLNVPASTTAMVTQFIEGK